ncbi:tetrahydrofolate dehydrogenase/cyclohydrolase catalytic domain-containing protein [Streptomyces sp. NPDC047002]|uniref:bifunctional 5,10-methylenetetrahydrofolate dehydrogenase/5,10-methenyltetrahydrofolate cyclohydrolase n=1 Tax=Streptomyces sp. NPDC047002 TaxID=3155475 RepID=UPI003456F2C2
MSAEIIDGRACAARLKQAVALEAKDLRERGLPCALSTVMVGDDYSAAAYERRLRRAADELDIPYRRHALPRGAGQRQVTEAIADLNADPEVTGVLVLRPLPAGVREADVFRTLSPLKDIEAVNPENAGLLALGTPRYVPSTAASAFHLLDSWLDDAGEDRTAFYRRSLIVVVGRSNNVGKPLVSLAYHRQAAVESVDEWASRSATGLGPHLRRADVVIVAAGQAGLITGEHVKEGAVVIDVGINPVTDDATGRLRMVGDADFASVAARARAVSPVPGGVGPVTDIWLMRNTVAAARLLSGAAAAC